MGLEKLCSTNSLKMTSGTGRHCGKVQFIFAHIFLVYWNSFNVLTVLTTASVCIYMCVPEHIDTVFSQSISNIISNI